MNAHTFKINYPSDEFIHAAATKTDESSTAYTGNNHMMAGYAEGFRAGAWWAHGHLAGTPTLEGGDQ